MSITYANGTEEQFNNYNPLGEAAQFVNANGQAIGFTYNSQGLVATENFADGSSYSYTYDVHGEHADGHQRQRHDQVPVPGQRQSRSAHRGATTPTGST